VRRVFLKLESCRDGELSNVPAERLCGLPKVRFKTSDTPPKLGRCISITDFLDILTLNISVILVFTKVSISNYDDYTKSRKIKIFGKRKSL